MRTLVIDVGTSGLRAAVVNDDASITGLHHEEFAASTPAPGLVEFDAEGRRHHPEVVKEVILSTQAKGHCLRAEGHSIIGEVPVCVTCFSIRTKARQHLIKADKGCKEKRSHFFVVTGGHRIEQRFTGARPAQKCRCVAIETRARKVISPVPGDGVDKYLIEGIP